MKSSENQINNSEMQKYIITRVDNLHFGETGFLTGESTILLNKKMLEIELENCDHDCKTCFIYPHEIKKIKNEKAGPK